LGRNTYSVFIPVTPEYFSEKGLSLLVNNIIRVKKRLNPNLGVDGILVTMLNERTILSREIIKTFANMVKYIRDNFGMDIRIFKSKIPISVKTGEAILHQKSVLEYQPKNKVSKAYLAFAQEWM